MSLSIRILQGALAVWNIIGATYLWSNYKDLANDWALTNFSPLMWQIFAFTQLALALLLLAALYKRYAKFTSVAALGLSIISICGYFIYSAYSGFPGMLWAVIPAALLLFIAFKHK